MKQMTITIQTKSPIVLSAPGNTTLLTATRNSFGGTTLRGLAAAQFIAQNHLCDAHTDEEFRRLFFGGVRFVDAYPQKDGKVAFPLPASLQKKKDGTQIFDLFFSAPESGFKTFSGLGIVKNEADIVSVSVKKSMALHMSRNGELPDTSGKAGTDNWERLSGKSEEGHIYNYESIDEGQTFIGALVGEEKDLLRLREVLGESWRGRAGRSRFTEYGEVECSLGKVDSDADIDAEPAPEGNRVWLRLQTPILPVSGDASSAVQVIEECVVKELRLRAKADFAIEKIFANTEPVDSFVGIWQLRRPRQTALSAGSCFSLEKKDGVWTPEDVAVLRELMYMGVGLRTEEGFGQLRGWKKNDWKPGAEDEPAVESDDLKITNETVRKKAADIVRAKQLEQFRLYAADDVKNSSDSIAKHPTHVFSRLDGLLAATTGEELKESFQRRLNEALWEKSSETDEPDKEKRTAFAKHMQDIKITLPDGKYPLEELLTGNPAKPYNTKERLGKMNEEIRAFYRAIGGPEGLSADDEALFREYWHWFFRHARKTKTRKGAKS